VACANHRQIVVLQFHGSPDVAHPWIHTPPERLRRMWFYEGTQIDAELERASADFTSATTEKPQPK